MPHVEVGIVRAIHRFPVKSMLGEALDRAEIDSGGVVGDRHYALVDDETGKVVSVKRPTWWGRMFELSARTSADEVEVQFPDGVSLAITDPDLPPRLSGFLGRSVSIASSPPPGATFDEVWVRELKNDIDPLLDVQTRVEDGDEMIDGGYMSVTGQFFNALPIHVVTTSTTRQLTGLAPGSRFDPLRFRPNIVLETEGEGFIENAWAGHALHIGNVELAVAVAVPRCVMTTLEQGDMPADRNVLRAISRHNAVDIGLGPPVPCVGIYTEVSEAGEIAVGMPAVLEKTA
jgi:uncharacterized protein YcbX